MVYHRILNMLLCAIQEDLAVYPFYIQKLTFANTNLHPSLNPHPLATTSQFSTSVILFTEFNIKTDLQHLSTAQCGNSPAFCRGSGPTSLFP